MTDSSTIPTIAVYQNVDHVVGIVEQALGEGSVTDGAVQSSSRSEHSKDKNRGGGVTAQAGGSLPVIAKAGVDADASIGNASHQGAANEWSFSTNRVYTRAYQLSAALNALRNNKQLHAINSHEDSDAVRVGDFVEFQATFRPNQLIALLDVLTPDLVARIARYSVEKKRRDGFEEALRGAGDEYQNRLQSYAQRTEDEARSKAALWADITRALRADFRSEATREYYGSLTVENGPTAITVCETEHFITADPDRLLDGTFTVLGKIASEPVTERPVLQRNKLAARINSNTLAELFETMREQARQPVNDNLKGKAADILDVKFDATIPGTSFNVLPVAIYL